jgi:N-acetylmuramoyl-L-alanine amidase
MKKIYINPGHSEKDPGAVGFETERRLNVAVSRYMEEYLQTHYVCQTKVNSGDSLYALCDEANAWGADLYVSNHFNAAGGDGFECYIYSKNTMALGKLFAKHVKAAGQNLRMLDAVPGVKIRTNLAVLYRTNMPAILTEGAFVDNQKDIADWNDESELQTLGIAYARAAAEYLGLEEKEKPWYRVQVGAYRDKANAQAQLEKLRAAGFADAYIKES